MRNRAGLGRAVALLLLAVNAVLLVLIVFLPPEDHQALDLVWVLADFAGRFGVPVGLAARVIEFGANIVLFVPFGLLVPPALGWLRPWGLVGTVVLGAAVSTAIETIQLFIPGRVTSVLDVIANTLGTLCGVLLIALVQAWRREERERRRLAGMGRIAAERVRSGRGM
ncbi:VanZ family protein [Leucobacter sp. CSA1]|uniref:VanZ family protein n=1 Tax=Leucobacter chromiisoli TaxID=2796471 RepID=A0A934UW16_9MICO|nr:VanZ family protein [Leucobacter chromiisoli]MBK0419462.1 VanZ family protein [Leucobacter chromiisoli]